MPPDDDLFDCLCEKCREKITRASGGTHLYIPTATATDRIARNARIRELFTGSNIPALAATFHLSIRQIYRIITEK